MLPLAGDAGLVRAVERSRAWALGEQKGCRDSFPQRPIPEMSWALPAPVDCGRIAGGLQEQGGCGLRDDDVPSGYGLRAPGVGLVSLGPPRERDPGNGGRSGAQSCRPRLSSPPGTKADPSHGAGRAAWVLLFMVAAGCVYLFTDLFCQSNPALLTGLGRPLGPSALPTNRSAQRNN